MLQRLATLARSTAHIAARLNPWHRLTQSTLTREGWYYLLVMAFVVCGGLLRDINLLLVVAGMMAGPMFYNWRHAVVTLRGATVRRNSNTVVGARQPLSIDLRLANASRRKTCSAILVEETLTGDSGPARGEHLRGAVLFGHVPPGEQRHAAYQLRVPLRGRYRSRTIRATTRFPFGLIRRSSTTPTDAQLTVYPQLGQLTRAWYELQSKFSLGTRSRNQLGHRDGDFLGLRDWRPGDPRRWIHWRTSARRGSLVVRQFEQQDNEELTLLLDLFVPPKSSAQAEQEVERIIRFAATVAASWSRRRDRRIRIVVAGAEFQEMAGTASKDFTTAVLTALAVAMPSKTDHLTRLLKTGLTGPAHRGITALVSPRQNQLADPVLFDQVGANAELQRRIMDCRWLTSAGSGLDLYFQDAAEQRHG